MNIPRSFPGVLVLATLASLLPAPVDAGLAIGNLVWEDSNANGHRDPGEAGIDGVTLRLTRDSDLSGGPSAGDELVATTTTSGGGGWLFDALAPTDTGPQYLLEVLPENFLPGHALAGLATSAGEWCCEDDADHGRSPGHPYGPWWGPVPLNPGQETIQEDGDPDTNLTIDFGFRPVRPLTLGNLVFRDVNNNGVRDPGEDGLDGVIVDLYRDTDLDGGISAGDTLIARTMTTSGGWYEFTSLEPTTDGAHYHITVAYANFAPGGALRGLVSSDGEWCCSDNTDHGRPVSYPYGSWWGSVPFYYGQGPEDEDGDPNTTLSIDFGFRPAEIPAIGNLVFRDANNDGRFNPADGDAGIDGVVLNLYLDAKPDGRDAGDGPPIATTTSAGGGGYRFSDLPRGMYLVEIDAANFARGGALAGLIASPYANGNPNDDQDHDSNGYLLGSFSVVSGQLSLEYNQEPVSDGDNDPNTNLTLDFGFVDAPGLSLGDLVWNDLNANGVRDAGEPGIPGVSLGLYRDNGDGQFDGGDPGIAGTTSDALGRYRFTGLEPGRYFVRVDEWNFRPGSALFGLVGSPGQAAPDSDVDDNDDGTDSDIPVRDRIVSSLVTLAAGTEPAAAIDGDGPDGNLTIDFGVYAPANPPVLSIGDLVWSDLNGDGLRQPGEPGIPNVSLSLYRDDGNGSFDGNDVQLLGTGTDGNGRYEFSGLPPGSYFVRVDPWSFLPGSPLYGLASSPGQHPVGEDADDDDNGLDWPFLWRDGSTSTLIALAAGTEPTGDGDGANGNRTVDFGFWASPTPPVLSLGDLVWNDLNGNGVRDPGEPGIPNVTLSLFTRDDAHLFTPAGGAWHLTTAATDADGRYAFRGLPAGTYRVQIAPWNFPAGGVLAGFASSPGASDPENNIDNDDNGADSNDPANQGIYSGWISVAHGTEPDTGLDGDGTDGNATVDFGLIPLPAGGPNLAVGGSVFEDLDNNGLRDVGEAGVDGVAIDLFLDDGNGSLGDGDSWVANLTTTAGGTYRFANLVPGDYMVVVNRYSLMPGGPLAGHGTSTGNDPVPDPDNDVAGDDNGADAAAFGLTFFGVATAPVSLREGTEPPGDGDDANGNQTVDLGFAPDLAMGFGGTVFRDDNANGRFDLGAGEAGVAGVPVGLWIDQNGSGIVDEGDSNPYSTTTDADGRWSFSVPPGQYMAVVYYHSFLTGRPLNGLRSSSLSVAATDPDDDVDNDNNGQEIAGWGRPFYGVCSHPATLLAGTEPGPGVDGDDAYRNSTIDFGFQPGPTLALGDRIFRDVNGNGVFDAGDVGIANVHVKLFLDQGDGVLGSGDEDVGIDISTEADGSYHFSGLPEGNYLVVIPHDNWWPGRPLNGLRSIGGPNPAPSPDTDRSDNDDNGEERTLPWWPSLQVSSRVITLRSATGSHATVDFGFDTVNPTLAVGGTLFRDANNDGFRQSATDTGLPNVAVDLYADSNLDGILSPGDQGLGQTRTDSDGRYRFTGLLPGNYLISIPASEHYYGQGLTGLRLSTGNAPAPDPDDDLPGDNNGLEYLDPGSGNWVADATAAVTLAFGTEPDTAVDGDDANGNLTVDVGFREITGTTFVVTSGEDTNDGACDAHCTLREAILAANRSPGPDLIVFNIPGAGVHTLRLTSALDPITEPVIIDGLTQPGASCASWPPTLLIELDGSGTAGETGLRLEGSRSTIRGLVINRFFTGATFGNGGHNRAECNFLGTDPAGALAQPGSNVGIEIYSADNIVGGDTPADRNLVSGNNLGVRLSGIGARANAVTGNFIGTGPAGTGSVPNNYAGLQISDAPSNVISGNLISGNANRGLAIEGQYAAANRVTANRIGTAASGSTALHNQGDGLYLGGGAHDNRIGGNAAGEGNLISGNLASGVVLANEGTTGNLVLGNRIGTDTSGTVALPNQIGVQFADRAAGNRVGIPGPFGPNVIAGNSGPGLLGNSTAATANRISANLIGVAANGTDPLPNQGPGIQIAGGTGPYLIGGTAPGEGNTIAHNGQWGVLVQDPAGAPVTLQGNRIFGNAFLGIDLTIPGGASGVTVNDPLDADAGVNGLQNFPDLFRVSGSAGTTVVDGSLNAAPNRTYRLEFFANSVCDPSGFGEGQSPLGSLDVTTDAGGVAWFVVSLPLATAPGQVVTATATDPDGNTSEFSACRTVVAEGGPTIVAANTRGTRDTIEVIFSESIDPATATSLANYGLSSGATILAVNPGDNPRTVRLTTSPLADGTAYVLTIQGLTDRATPPNAIASGSAVSVFQTLGSITRREYRSIPGFDVPDLLAHPRFPGQPTVIDYPTAFEAPSNLGSFLGQQMLGYLHPPATGDYVFHLSADERARLYLSTDDQAAHKVLIATEEQANPARQWNHGQRNAVVSFPAGTRFVEAEDFDFNHGQWLSGSAIGLDGPYPGGSYAGLGSAADADIDWHEVNSNNHSPNYRTDTGVELGRTEHPTGLTRAGFEVSTVWMIGYEETGDWRNYTRDFGTAQDYRVYARLTAAGLDSQTSLDEVTAGVGTPSQTTIRLGTFQVANTGSSAIYDLVPLVDDQGQPRTISLGGLHTLRYTVTGPNTDVDYLAFVPATGPAPAISYPNISAPIHLEAGRKYYVEALAKEGYGDDNLAVAWRMPGAAAPVNGSSPIPGAYLEAIVDPTLQPTTPPPLSIGNLVFQDLNDNGQFEPELGETGVDGVTLNLYRDLSPNSWLEPGDGPPIATTVTAGGGFYRFDGLGTDIYFVEIPRANFGPGGALAFQAPGSNPDNGNNDRDNTSDGFIRGERYGVVSNGALWLEDGREPTWDGDGDPNSNLTLDFGFRPATAPGAIGDLVYLDANGDGHFNAADGDLGIPGVTLSLYRDDGNGRRDGADGPAIASAISDADGRYRFDNLGPADYHVEIDAANLAPGGVLAARIPTPSASQNPNDDQDSDSNGIRLGGHGIVAPLVRLETGREPVSEDGEPNTNLTIDFGFIATPGLSLGDLIWSDTNGNGLREPGEPGIPDVLVALIRDDGDGIYMGWESFVTDTRTDALGRYQFTGLDAGTYFVVAHAQNFLPGQPLYGMVSATGAAEANTDVEDNDDGSDSVIPVRRGVASTAVTLAPGTEPITDGNDANGNWTVDLGFVMPAQPAILALGGVVFLDPNGNGLRDPGEPGVPGINLTLLRDDGDGVAENNGEDLVIYGGGTDAAGRYVFEGLTAGQYFAAVNGGSFLPGQPLYGLLSSPGAAPADANVAGDDNGVDHLVPTRQGITSTMITLANGAEPADDGDNADRNQTLDFAFTQPAQPPVLELGGHLFHDVNANGIRDPGEPGISNLYLMAFRDDGDGVYEPYSEDPQANDAWVDANGHWELSGLTPGGYWILVPSWFFNPGNPLAGLTSSPGVADPNADVPGDDNGIDSPAPWYQHVFAPLILLANGTEPGVAVDGDDTDSNQTIDFGFVDLPAGGPHLRLGGLVFDDTNNNGLRDSGEAGIDGVGLELWMDNGDGHLGSGDFYAASISTSGGGRYEFSNLVPGDYLVLVQRDSFLPGRPLSGRATSTGNDPAPDPDNDVADDDNGTDVSAFGNAFHGVATAPVSLREAAEPVADDGDPNSNLTVDFGFRPDGALTLGGTVFRDDNADGHFQPGAGEAGIPNVTVELWFDSNHDGLITDVDGSIAGTVTDPDGRWRYSLPPGEYAAVVRYHNFLPSRPLNGLRSSGTVVPPTDPDDDVDNDNNGSEFGGWGRPFFGVATRPITLAPGAEPGPAEDGDDASSNSTVDFGFHPGPTLAIGNQVFRDLNGSGRFDAGDAGVPDVHVKLFYDSNPDGVLGEGDEDLGIDLNTAADGSYSMAGLPEGNYLVVVPWDNWVTGRPLNGLRSIGGSAPAPAPDADATDNDDNGEEHTLSWWPSLQVASRVITLRHATGSTPAVDFGFDTSSPTLTLGGTVFQDADRDGQWQSVVEPGISNVVVELYFDSNHDGVYNPGDAWLGRTRTTAEGRYAFTGLLPGRYLLWISRWEHFYGQALTGLRCSTGVVPVPGPDDDVAGDNNGFEFLDPGTGEWSADVTDVVTLDYGTEPATGIDGDDANGNLTVDLGYQAVSGTTFVVNTTADHDDGTCDAADCTLREALQAANNHPGTDVITFAIPGAGAQTIQPASALPEILEPVDLDATSQPGYAGQPLIELDGSTAGGSATGLIVRGGHSRVRGLVINRFSMGGLRLTDGSHNVVQGNFLGTDTTGTLALGNGNSSQGGLQIIGSNDNLVGGPNPVDRNVVSGNDYGINAQPTDRTIIQGNHVGTDVSGTLALGNQNWAGIVISGSDNLVGGPNVADRNVVSGNNAGVDLWTGYGIYVAGTGQSNRVEGNFVGTDATGTTALPNHTGIIVFSPGSTVVGNLVSGNAYDGISVHVGVTVQGNIIGLNRTGTAALGNGRMGLTLSQSNHVGGTTAAARNIISANGADGITLCTGDVSANLIEGNYIGTDLSGTVAFGNGTGGWGPGIRTCSQSTSNVIRGNLIAANRGDQVDLRSSGNIVQGNTLGTDVTGTVALSPNGGGIGLYETAVGNLLGGPGPGEGNLIAGVGSNGIGLNGPGVGHTTILGNRIGTDPSGTLPVPANAGIVISDSSDNQVGDVTPGARNVIAFNRYQGVIIGGDSARNNSVRGNSIHDNSSQDATSPGLDLGWNSVTPNDAGDTDEGANRLQNFPTLLSASASATSLHLDGRLASTPGTTYVLDFYASPACRSSGYGEGATWLDTRTITTDAAGGIDFSLNLAISVPVGHAITATATDPDGNTSEFSACVTAQPEGPPTILAASTHGRSDRITLTFSEYLDPVSAENPAHYVIPGITISHATLGADRRTVTLTTSPLPDGLTLTLEYSGIADLAAPPSVVGAGTTVAIFNTQGAITRSVWLNLPGNLVSDLTSLPSYPGSPDLITYETGFEAPSNAYDRYGQRMAGYLTAPVTGDYVFYLTADDAAELWLSTDDTPEHKARLAQVTYWLWNARAWNSGPVNTPPPEVLRPDTLFIEAEDFDFGAREWLSGQAIGMTGPYAGGAYAGRGSAADEGVDFHEFSVDAAAEAYRPDTGIEMYPVTDPAERRLGHLSRGSFEVSQSWKIGWNYADEWRNYTREFPAPARDFWVYARIAADSPIAARLEQLAYGADPTPASTNVLGEFHSNGTADWSNFVFVPLTDPLGVPVRVSLGGLQTLRFTVIPGGSDLDYLAFVPAPAGAEPPSTRAENVSAPVHLTAGQRYYVEALSRDGGGSDHLAVGWQIPGGAAPIDGDPAIPGQYLSSLSPSGAASVLQPLADVTTGERGSASFRLELTGTPPLTIQWLRNGVPIPGANGYRLELSGIPLSDDGARYRAEVSNEFSSTTSSEALLHVTPDTTAPEVVSVTGSGSLNRVRIRFSEPVSTASGTNLAHYAVSDDLTVLAARVEPDGRTVVLSTAPQTSGRRYGIAITGILDTAATPNALAADFHTRFSAWEAVAGQLNHQFFAFPANGPLFSLAELRADPRYPGDPTREENLDAFEWPPAGASEGTNDYGNRISGWLVAPVTGDYRFYVNSDDTSEVWLSTDAEPAHAVLIAFEPQWNNPRQWRTTDRRTAAAPENVSSLIPLVAGQRYWMEAIHTEGGGGDNLAVTWQLPGAPEVVNGALPIAGQFFESLVNPDRFIPVLSSITPAFAPKGGGAFTLQIEGSNFLPGAVVWWNNSPRPTLVVDAQHVTTVIPAADLALPEELDAIAVSVRNTHGPASDPLALTITGPLIADAISAVATIGETASVSTAPTTSGDAGVSASVDNAGSGDPIVITSATYTQNPASDTPMFDVGGRYVDVKVAGAEPADVAASVFYYPDNVTGATEAALALLYWNGIEWLPVRGRGGAVPVKDTTDNLDGTVSGGRFSVVLDDTSTPKLTDLTGLFFTFAPPPQHPPVAATDTIRRRAGSAVKVAVAELLANDTDAEAEPITLVSVDTTSAGGATVTLRQGWVFYQPSVGNDVADSFTYRITDGNNAPVTGTVLVQLADPDNGAGRNLLGISISNGAATLRFVGIPNRAYTLQVTADLGTPNWQPLATVTANALGEISFVDPDFGSHPARFYRTVAP